MNVLVEAGPYVLQGYEWDASASRYRSDETGRFVARTRIMDLLERSTTEREGRLRAGVQAMLDGRISENTWFARASSMLQREYVQNAALAAGGWDRLTDADRAGITTRLADQFTHLRQLGADMTKGEASSAQAQARMDMYVGEARAEYYQVERARLPAAAEGNVTIEIRDLGEPYKHCPECFPADTLIRLTKRWAPIQDVRVGDMAITTMGPRPVIDTMHRLETELWRVESDSFAVTCTGNHPFLLPSGEWWPAHLLATGQQVVLSKDTADSFHGQVALPDALDDVSARGQVGRLAGVTFVLCKLTRVERLETRVPMPVVTVNLNDQVAYDNVADKLLVDDALGNVGDSHRVEHVAQPLFGLAAALNLAYEATLQKVTSIFVTSKQCPFAHRLSRLGRELASLVSAGSATVDKTVISVRNNGNAKARGTASHLLDRTVKMISAVRGAMCRIFVPQKHVLNLCPITVTITCATEPGMFVVDRTAALFACWFSLFRPACRTQSDFAQLDGATRTKIMGLTAMPTEQGLAVDSATYTSHGEATPVYNLEVADAHHYIANGFVVHNCLGYHARGWQHSGDLPLPTEECSCGGNCRCELRRREVPANQADGWIGHRGGPGDEMADAGYAEYSDDQPRDEAGRFTDAGGGTGGQGMRAGATKQAITRTSSRQAACPEPGLPGYPRGVPEGDAARSPEEHERWQATFNTAAADADTLYRGVGLRDLPQVLSQIDQDGRLYGAGWVTGERTRGQLESTVGLTISPRVASTFGGDSGVAVLAFDRGQLNGDWEAVQYPMASNEQWEREVRYTGLSLTPNAITGVAMVMEGGYGEYEDDRQYYVQKTEALAKTLQARGIAVTIAYSDAYADTAKELGILTEDGWDPDLHPRDEAGRFSDAGGGPGVDDTSKPIKGQGHRVLGTDIGTGLEVARLDRVSAAELGGFGESGMASQIAWLIMGDTRNDPDKYQAYGLRQPGNSGQLEAMASVRIKGNDLEVRALASTRSQPGQGTAMMAYICRIAGAEGRGVTLDADPDAVGFYEKLGMTRVYEQSWMNDYMFTADGAHEFAQRYYGQES